MKKIILIVSGVVVIAGGGWYFWSRSVRPAGTSVRPIENPATSTPSTATTTPSEQDQLAAQATAIINRPIVINSSFSPEQQRLSREKIEELIGMIRANYNYDAPWLELGAYRKLNGDYQGAIQAWEFVALIRPQSFVAFHNLGELYGFQLKNYAKGEEYFLRSLANNPENIDGYAQLATLYESQSGKNSLAEKILLQGITANPNNARLKILLGDFYETNGNKTEALKYFEAALLITPNDQALIADIARLRG